KAQRLRAGRRFRPPDNAEPEPAEPGDPCASPRSPPRRLLRGYDCRAGDGAFGGEPVCHVLGGFHLLEIVDGRFHRQRGSSHHRDRRKKPNPIRYQANATKLCLPTNRRKTWITTSAERKAVMNPTAKM